MHVRTLKTGLLRATVSEQKEAGVTCTVQGHCSTHCSRANLPPFTTASWDKHHYFCPRSETRNRGTEVTKLVSGKLNFKCGQSGSRTLWSSSLCDTASQDRDHGMGRGDTKVTPHGYSTQRSLLLLTVEQQHKRIQCPSCILVD